MIKKIQQYILQRQNLSSKPVDETNILLGSNPKKIKLFITFKDFHKNIHPSIKKIKDLIGSVKGKLIINGNLQQKHISKLMKLAMKAKGDFTVVVNDGYRLSKKKNFEKSSQIALILESLAEK